MHYHKNASVDRNTLLVLWACLGFLGVHRFFMRDVVVGILQMLVCVGSLFFAIKGFSMGMAFDGDFLYYLAIYVVLFGVNLMWWAIDYYLIFKR